MIVANFRLGPSVAASNAICDAEIGSPSATQAPRPAGQRESGS